MTKQEFNELVSAVLDSVTSFKSCQISEREAESCRVQKWVARLRECQWPKRLNDQERQRALSAMNKGNEVLL